MVRNRALPANPAASAVACALPRLTRLHNRERFWPRLSYWILPIDLQLQRRNVTDEVQWKRCSRFPRSFLKVKR